MVWGLRLGKEEAPGAAGGVPPERPARGAGLCSGSGSRGLGSADGTAFPRALRGAAFPVRRGKTRVFALSRRKRWGGAAGQGVGVRVSVAGQPGDAAQGGPRRSGARARAAMSQASPPSYRPQELERPQLQRSGAVRTGATGAVSREGGALVEPGGMGGLPPAPQQSDPPPQLPYVWTWKYGNHSYEFLLRSASWERESPSLPFSSLPTCCRASWAVQFPPPPYPCNAEAGGDGV